MPITFITEAEYNAAVNTGLVLRQTDPVEPVNQPGYSPSDFSVIEWVLDGKVIRRTRPLNRWIKAEQSFIRAVFQQFKGNINNNIDDIIEKYLEK